MTTANISQSEFFALPEVVELTSIQMRNPFHSKASRNARLPLRESTEYTRQTIQHWICWSNQNKERNLQGATPNPSERTENLSDSDHP